MTTTHPRMNPAILRTLEDWTTHQDYFWFLAMLAWGAFLGAELKRKEHREEAGHAWLIAFAGFQMIGALIELVLLAQDLLVPYTKLDLAMGAAQAGGTAALAWRATRSLPSRRSWRFTTAVVLVGSVVGRWWLPVEAGISLSLVHTIAVLILLRREPGLIPQWVGGLLVLGPLVATHGPWAYAIDHGRRITDWSHFALAAAAVSIAAGSALATRAWRRRLSDAIPAGRAGETLRRDLRRAALMLIGWLAGGMLLAFWYGAHARRAFESHLLRRVELSALALDPKLIADTLGRELRIESIHTQRNAHGAAVDVATIPEAGAPVFEVLRSRMKDLRARNSDLRFLELATVREARLVVIGTAPRRSAKNPYITHVIRDITPAGEAALRRENAYVEGPNVSFFFGAIFEARTPLRHPETGKVIGWLIAAVDATRWAVTFVQARLQTMALVAAGGGLWTGAVAYRLRREARDAAEQKAAAAAAADRMKSAFLAKVSHELRTPIQSVLGYSELLASAPLVEPHRTWLGALRTHGDVMLRLVNDLIDLGALQSGAFQLEGAPVKLRRVIEECVAALRPSAAAKSLDFEVDLAPNLPAWVRADGVRLRQVLLNLLTNAVKFTRQGRVSLTVRRHGNDDIEFVVADTGPGIPPAQRSRLFQPFARLDPTAAGGTGLGLALVQGICSAMGGDVRLADDGAGATFIVRCPLPECEPAREEPASAAPAPSGFAGLQVLVAEDNTLVRELLVAFLAGAGAEVSVARDGPSALALAREFPPDVLLLDVGLPGLDGIAVAETLRREGAQLRIIGLSAHATAADEARARAAGMDEFLTKPVSLGRLAQAIGAQAQSADEMVVGRLLDDSLQQRLAGQFARETPLVLADLRSALAANDWPRLGRAAHYLKNSADVLGIPALQIACEQLYLVSSHPETGDLPALLQAVEMAIPPELLVSADANSSDFT